MKKIFLTLALACFALVSLRADLIWYEDFTYVDGPIIAVGTNNVSGVTNWFRHSGGASPSDALVSNNKLQNSATVNGGTVTRQDDVSRPLCTSSCTYSSTPTVLYASFTVHCTNLPTVTNYFAHFNGNSTNFQARMFALPGTRPSTWRLGVSAISGSVNKIFPADLARDVDYQVVVGWNPTASDSPPYLFSGSATLWVNAISAADTSLVTGDAFVPASQPIPIAYGFRQANSSGNWFCYVTNLAVATTFDEAANNVWSTTPVAPVIAYSPQSGTNYVGDNVLLSGVAAGQGLGSMTYQWLKNSGLFTNPDGNTNTLRFASAAISTSGAYQLVAKTPYGLSATSAVANLWVTNPPVAPTITTQPATNTVFFGETATLYCGATSSGTPSYTWYYNNSTVASLSNPNVSGDGTPTLTIANVQTNNNTTGIYRCDVANIYGTTPSSNALLSAIAPPLVTIGYLRTLVDPVFFLPTNTTGLWTVTGTVTTWTNVTTPANASFYIQDGTGGINVFFGGNPNCPQAGDSVTVTGPLGQYNSLLELNLNSANPAHSVVTNSSGNLLPAGAVLPFSFTNSAAYGGVGNAIRLYQSSVVTFTNVYFAAAGGTFAGGQNYVLTNQAGETFALRLDARVFDIIGQPIPAFAWTVTGPMGYFGSATAPDRSAWYQILPTRYADIVTTSPPQVTVNVALSGNNAALTWTAQPYMSYTVLRAANVNGPYVPLAGGLTFNTTAGQYTETSSSPSTRFYRVLSP